MRARPLLRPLAHLTLVSPEPQSEEYPHLKRLLDEQYRELFHHAQNLMDASTAMEHVELVCRLVQEVEQCAAARRDRLVVCRLIQEGAPGNLITTNPLSANSANPASANPALTKPPASAAAASASKRTGAQKDHDRRNQPHSTKKQKKTVVIS